MLTLKQEIMVDRVIDSLDFEKFAKVFNSCKIKTGGFPGKIEGDIPSREEIEKIVRELLEELLEDYSPQEGAREFNSSYFHFLYYTDEDGDDHVIVDFIPDETEVIFGKDGSINKVKSFEEDLIEGEKLNDDANSFW